MGAVIASRSRINQPEFVFGETLLVEYTLDEYLNESRGETWAPHHWTDAVVVFYSDPSD